MVFIIAKNKQSEANISLIDISKPRMICHGFVGPLECARVCSLETFEISVSGKSFLRRLRSQDGVWHVEDKLPKKLSNMDTLFHDWLEGERCLAATVSSLHII